MIATLIAMWGLAGATAFMAWRRPGRFAVGLGYAKEQLLIILPRLPISFFAAGFIAELLPKDQMLFMPLSISGRDPVAFADAQTFDPERPVDPNRRHIAERDID